MATSKKNMSEEEWQLLENIGEMYKSLRLAAGLQQREAARALGTSQARIPVLEKGQADVMVTTLSRWASLYGYQLEIKLIPIEDEFTKALREAAEALEAECDCAAHEWLGRECTCYCVHSERKVG